MALTVKWGSLISSIRYKIRSDGSAITIRIIAGIIVHTISISWASIALVFVSLVVIIVVII